MTGSSLGGTRQETRGEAKVAFDRPLDLLGFMKLVRSVYSGALKVQGSRPRQDRGISPCSFSLQLRLVPFPLGPRLFQLPHSMTRARQTPM